MYIYIYITDYTYYVYIEEGGNITQIIFFDDSLLYSSQTGRE